MSKQLWYANSTGGAPYTYGERYRKVTCPHCCGWGRLSIRGTGRLKATIYGAFIHEMRSNWIVCYACKGKGFARKLI